MTAQLTIPSSTLQLVRVFLASPSDLALERRLARDAVEEINKTIARPNGFHVDLIGWEDTISERRRPQEAINEDLRTCELFVGMMWKKWGTPPDTTGEFSSGFEEEFTIATSSYDSVGTPKIRLYFKEIEESLLNDPGDDLKKVLHFRKGIEEQKKTLYELFREPTDFASRFRISLADYINRLRVERVRAQESDSTASRAPTLERPDSDSAEQQDANKGAPSLQGSFLSELASVVGDVSRSPSPVQVARLRNLTNSLARSENDRLTLQAHDANIIYSFKDLIDLSGPEITSITDAGLAAYSTDNLPIWHWVSDRTLFLKEWLALSTKIGLNGVRIGSFRALIILGADIPDTVLEEARQKFVASWFDDDATDDLRVEALRYLAALGRKTDIEIVDRELERKNASTLTASLEAHISILLRHVHARAAAEFALTQSFDSLDTEVLKPIVAAMAELPDKLLTAALSHRCSDVRMGALCVLEERRLLTIESVRALLSDASLSVREKALRTLEALEERTWTKEDAKPVLLRKKSAGLFGGGDAHDWEGEAALERVQVRELEKLPRRQLEAMSETGDAQWFLAFEALCRRHFAATAQTIRRDFDDRFQARFERYLSATRAIAPGNAAVEALVKRLGDSGDFARRGWLRRTADLLLERGEAADLARIRKALDEDAMDPSQADIPFLGRRGDWEDIGRIQKINADYRSQGLGVGLLGFKPAHAVSATAIVRLARNRFSELLNLDLGGELRAAVFYRVDKTRLRNLTDDELIRLLSSNEETVRKVVALRCVQDLPSKRVSALARRYLDLDYRYYNVIRWLDLALSFAVSIASAGASRELNRVAAKWR